VSSYILGLLLIAIYAIDGANRHEIFIAAVIMVAAGDIRRQIKEKA